MKILDLKTVSSGLKDLMDLTEIWGNANYPEECVDNLNRQLTVHSNDLMNGQSISPNHSIIVAHWVQEDISLLFVKKVLQEIWFSVIATG